jgi:NAD(P)-dependent dehydrogenase (short-subunit alcohol dehydrogenase family)
MINYELDGKVAVVTGAASGIGLACDHALARSGAAVCLWDLNAEPLETAAAELGQYGHPTRTAVVDVSDSDRVTEAMEAVANDLGRVDIVVANAGIGGEQKPTAEYSDASWHKVIGVNLDGVTKAAAWEHAADGVRVNAVGPGFILTPLLEANLDQAAIDFLASQHALQRMG